MTEVGFDPPSLRYGRAPNPIPDAIAWSELGSKVAAASRLSFHAYHPRRDASATFKKFTYDEIVARDTAPRDSADESAKPDRRARPAQQGRDKANLDILWLKDESLEDTENFPAPAVLAAAIVASLESALEEFRGVEDALSGAE